MKEKPVILVIDAQTANIELLEAYLVPLDYTIIKAASGEEGLAKISGSQAWSVEDEALAGLSDEQIRACPCPGKNSIAWLLWHITRIEDLSINFLVLEQPQVLLSAGAAWLPRLGLASPDVGASMNEVEVLELSTRVSVPALKEYREAVGRSTRAGVARLQAAQLKQVIPDTAIQQLRDEGSISPKGEWLAEYYTGRTKGFFLTRTATSHNFIHLNEAGRARERLLRQTGL